MKWTKLLIITISLLLPSCTAWDALKAVIGDKPGLSVEAQVGDREAKVAAGNASSVGDIELEKGNVAVDNSNKTSKVGQAGSVTINEGNNWLVLGLVVLALLGWCLPTPAELWRRLRK